MSDEHVENYTIIIYSYLCWLHIIMLTFQQHLHISPQLIQYSRACGSYHEFLIEGGW